MDKGFREQLAEWRNHQPASAVGITTLGASPAVKARQIQQFNARAQAELSNAFKSAQKQSVDYQNSLTAARDAPPAREAT